jgi:hypothetical protein
MHRWACLPLLFCLFASMAVRAGSPVDTLKETSLRYNGTEYTQGYSFNNESPFFGGDDWHAGAVLYYEHHYADIRLQYDLLNDVVLLQYPYGESRIQLIRDKLEAFWLEQHYFRKLRLPDQSTFFAEQLYKGKRTLLLEWQKRIVLTLAQQEKYESYQSLYLLDGNKVSPVTSAEDLLNQMGDRKKAIRQAYRKSDYSFRKDKIAAATYILQQAELAGW